MPRHVHLALPPSQPLGPRHLRCLKSLQVNGFNGCRMRTLARLVNHVHLAAAHRQVLLDRCRIAGCAPAHAGLQEGSAGKHTYGRAWRANPAKTGCFARGASAECWPVEVHVNLNAR